jgi:hypothetical protein
MGRHVPVSYTGEARKEYGEDAPRIGVKTIALDNTTTDKEYEMGGNIIWVPDASDLDAKIEIKYQEQTNDPIPIQHGSFIGGPPFSRLFISWEAQASKTITLLYTRGPKQPFRIENATANYTGVSVTGTVDVDIQNQPIEVELEDVNTVTSVADYSVPATTTANIASALAGQKSIIISNLASNTQTMRIGDSSTGATRGQPLAPGETLILDTSDDIYAYNPGGSAESLSLIRLRKV